MEYGNSVVGKWRVAMEFDAPCKDIRNLGRVRGVPRCHRILQERRLCDCCLTAAGEGGRLLRKVAGFGSL
jgi:hypothetical protein